MWYLTMVGILKVCAKESDRIKLLVIRLTAHCNVLKRDNYLLSPDFFGEIRDLLKQNYNCPVMLVQGSAGNIAPKYFKSKETPFDTIGEQFVRSETALEDIAKVVFVAASPIIEKIETKAIDSINMYTYFNRVFPLQRDSATMLIDFVVDHEFVKKSL